MTDAQMIEWLEREGAINPNTKARPIFKSVAARLRELGADNADKQDKLDTLRKWLDAGAIVLDGKSNFGSALCEVLARATKTASPESSHEQED